MDKTNDNGNGIGKYYSISLVVCLFIYIALGASYWVDEFYRPICYLFLPISSLVCLTFFITALLKGANKGLAIRKGLVIGMSISFSLMIINYLVKKPTDLSYEVTSITNGRGGTMNMEIRTIDNEEVVFNILGDASIEKLSEAKLHLFKGIIGFYFGDWEPKRKSNGAEPE